MERMMKINFLYDKTKQELVTEKGDFIITRGLDDLRYYHLISQKKGILTVFPLVYIVAEFSEIPSLRIGEILAADGIKERIVDIIKNKDAVLNADI